MQGIMEKIKSEAEKKAKTIESECEKETARIRAEAEGKARTIIAKAREKAANEAETAEKRIIARANLNAKKEVAALLDKKLEEILGEAREGLAALRKEKAFAKKLNRFVLEAIQEIPSDSIVIEVSPEDAKLLPAKAKCKNAGIEIAKGLGPGAIVKSADGSIRIDCTFSTLLEEKKAYFKKDLAEEVRG